MVMASHVLSTNSSRTDFENHRDILSAVAGVVFLGTPHRGSSFAILANLKIGWGNRILRVSSNDEIITILTPNSYVLDELQRTFSQLCFDERMRRLKLVCYYEMKEIDLLRRLVVSRDSACLDGVPCRGMDVNHMNMNTFYDGDGGRHDSNYEHFLSDIRSIFHQGLDVVPERFNNWVYGSLTPDAERERLQRWLDPSRDIQTITYTEKLDIQRSAPYTCQWIHDTAEFKAWKGADESNALWISGTAGSGKSVLAAYIIKCLKDAGEADNGHFQPCSAAISEPCGYKNGSVPVLMFFCGVDRKSESTERILATLVHQLLLARPESQELFEVAQDLYQESLTGDETQSAILAKYLGHMAALVGPVL